MLLCKLNTENFSDLRVPAIVVDSKLFGMDPDPRIRTTDIRNREANKNNFSKV